MRPLLRLIVEAGGSISCGVYWNYTLRLTEWRRALWWWDRGGRRLQDFISIQCFAVLRHAGTMHTSLCWHAGAGLRIRIRPSDFVTLYTHADVIDIIHRWEGRGAWTGFSAVNIFTMDDITGWLKCHGKPSSVFVKLLVVRLIDLSPCNVFVVEIKSLS